MIPYYLLIALPVLTSGAVRLIKFKGKKEDHSHKVVLFVFFAFFILLLSLRSLECGVDMINYEHFFENAKTLKWENVRETDVELGYTVFEKVFQIFSKDFRLFMTVVAMVTLIPVWILYRDNTPYPLLTISIFITIAPFTMYFSGIRQVLAMAMVVPAWYLTKNKKFIWFVLVVALATLFHESAIVILLMYPIYYMKLTRKWLLIIIPAVLFVYVFNASILSLFLTGISKYAVKYGGAVSQTGAFGVLALLIVFLIYSYVIPDEETVDQDTMALRNMLVFSVLLQCFAPVHSLVMRFNYYYLMFVPICIPRIIKCGKSSMSQVARLSVVVMECFFMVYFILNGYFGSDVLRIFPYIPYWSSQI